MRKMIALTLVATVLAVMTAPSFATVPDNGQHQDLNKGKRKGGGK